MHATVIALRCHTQPVQVNLVIVVFKKDRLAAVTTLYCVHRHTG